MKVRNKLIQIKIGNKTYTDTNIIFNHYLYKLFNMQMDVDRVRNILTRCYLKLDTPIENVDYDSMIPITDFDIEITFPYTGKNYVNRYVNYTNNSLTLSYLFDNKCIFYVDNKYLAPSEINTLYAGRRITGIGFGGRGDYIYAFLDTDDMNLVINKNEEISILRIDEYQSDGICNGIDYPLHLINDTAEKDEFYVQSGDNVIPYCTKAQLYSVGFGNVIGSMEEEYLISDVITERTNNSITLDLSRNRVIGNYPNNDLQLGFYPTKDNSKYLIFKYRLYVVNENDETDYYYLDDYYTMSMANENFGNLEITLKLERKE